jgi:hypothetical protein
MAACFLLPAWSMILVGIVILIVGLLLLKLERDNYTHTINWVMVVVGAAAISAGITIILASASQYAYLIPCVTVVP